MFHHKLGWQTSDQQDKAVSCEVGVLLVLASVLQAVWGAGAGPQLCSLLCCLGLDEPRGRGPSCWHGQSPPPDPHPHSAQRAATAGPQAGHARAPGVWHMCPSFRSGPLGAWPELEWTVAFGVGNRPGNPGSQRTGRGGQREKLRTPAAETWGLIEPYLQQTHCLQSSQRQTRGGCGSLGHPGPGLLSPTQTRVMSAGLAWASPEVMSCFKNSVAANSTFPCCRHIQPSFWTSLPASSVSGAHPNQHP